MVSVRGLLKLLELGTHIQITSYFEREILVWETEDRTSSAECHSDNQGKNLVSLGETGLKNRDIREGGTILTPGVMEMQPATEQSSTSVELLQRLDTEQGRNKASPPRSFPSEATQIRLLSQLSHGSTGCQLQNSSGHTENRNNRGTHLTASLGTETSGQLAACWHPLQFKC